MAFDLEAALRRVIETGGSDLHLKVPSPPLIRIHGRLEPIPGADRLMPQDTDEVMRTMVTDEKKLAEFAENLELDFSFGLQGAGRFRVNAFHQRGSVSFVFRAIPSDIKTVEELNLPTVINDLADEERGIILVTGTTGSGKSTPHTVDAPESINRIIDFFEPHMQPQARAMLAGTLKGVISQRLARTADGQGRVAVCEVLKATSRIKDMVMDPNLTGNIPEAIAEGAYYGMQTFDQALLGHLQAGRIDMEEALSMSTSPHDFKLMAASGGATAMDNVEESSVF